MFSQQNANFTNLNRGITGLCFILFFLFFINPITGPDVPWHITTGKYILDTHTIPYEDPFSYAQDQNDIPFIGKFILSQYWLAQIVLASIYKYFGIEGLVIGRAALLTLIIALLWDLLGRKNILFSLIILGVYASNILVRYDEARPQLFTLLFMTLLFWLMEQYREKRSNTYLYPIPVLMLVWSNMHGGYIFGVMLLIFYLFSHYLSFLWPSMAEKLEVEKKPTFSLLAVVVMAITLSGCNPNGFDAFFYAFTTQSKDMFGSIGEYSTPFQFDKAQIKYSLIGYWLNLPITLILLVLSVRKRILFPSLLLSFTFVMTCSAIRYIPFLVICTIVSFKYIPLPIHNLFPETFNLKRELFLSIIVSGVIVMKVGALDKDFFQFNESFIYSTRAVKFLKDNELFGNIFASYNKSAFLLFSLYPNAKIYSDSRFISPGRIKRAARIREAMPMTLFPAVVNNLVAENYRIISPDDSLWKREREERMKWRKRLDDSGTEIIVHEVLRKFSGKLYTFLFALLEEHDWSLVYYDGRVAVFLKDIPRFHSKIEKMKLDKKQFYTELMLEAQRGLLFSPNNSYFHSNMALGLLLSHIDSKKTPYLLQQALEIDSKDIVARVAEQLYLKMKGYGRVDGKQ